MSSSTEYVAALRERADEYMLIIAAFRRMNEKLGQASIGASEPIREFCDRHIELNSRTLEEMERALTHAKSEIDTASPFLD